MLSSIGIAYHVINDIPKKNGTIRGTPSCFLKVIIR